MFQKPFVLAGLAVAATFAFTLDTVAQAQGPQRVPRVMAIWGNGQPPAPLDWDDEESVAMIVMPKTVEFDSFLTGVNPFDLSDYEKIVDTIATNRPDLVAKEQINGLATILFLALDDGTFLSGKEVRNVRQGGPELLPLVYWESGPPPNGAMAQAGPDGDITVLGTFWFKENSGTYPIASGAFILTTQQNATHRGQIAIGWFTK